MLVSLEDAEGLERRLKIQVPAEKVEKAVDSRLRSVGKGAKLKGFRPGKAPFKVIRQHYGDQVRREVLGELLQSSYQDAISEKNLNPAGGPRIESESMEPGKDLAYTAVIEVYPEIDLVDVSNIKVERAVAQITDDDMDHMLENLRRQKMEWKVVERPAKEGDRVTLDFEGTSGGKPFEGGSAKAVPVELGAKKMLKDFEEGLAGICVDEERKITMQFPEDYHHQDLAGEEGIFEVVAHKIEQGDLPDLDEEFCKTYGVEDGSLEKLKEEVRANMEREMKDVTQRQIRQQLLEQVVTAVDFPLPSALVDEEVSRLLKDATARQNKDLPAPQREIFQNDGQRRVKLGLIMGEIIRGQNLELDNDRVREKVLELAAGYQEPEELVRNYMSNPQLMQQIESAVLEDQAFDWLLEQSEVTDNEVAFKDLMNFDI